MNHDIPDPDRKDLRNFGLTTGGIVAVLFGLFFPWLLDRGIPVWPFVVFGILGIWGLAAPMSLRPVYYAWMRFGLVMNRIVTPVIMSVIFFLVFTPVALVMRVFGKDAMRRRFEDESGTYRIPSKKPSVNNLERLY